MATIQKDGFTVLKEDTEKSFDQIRRRSSIDLGCDGAGMTLRILGTGTGVEEQYASQIEAHACGKQGVYVRVPGGPWVLNTRR